MAIGAKNAVSTTDQIRVAMTGYCIGSAASAVAGRPLPQSSRIPCTRAEIGFHSARKASQDGMLSVGANVSATNVSGNIVVNMTPLTDSTDRIAEPTQIP